MNEHAHMDHHVKLYIKIFLSLMVLTAITVGIAYVDLGKMNDIVAMLIAVSKAMLVILFFMHVKDNPRLIKVLVSIGFFFFLILIAFTVQDYVTRPWDPSPIPLP